MKFGLSWNSEREVRGIRNIPENSVLRDPYEEFYPHWVSKIALSGATPRWGGKILEISDGKLRNETDIFYSGKKYDDPSGAQPSEMVRITFDYERAQAGKSPWRSEIRDAQSPFGREVDLEIAKNFIKGYGLSY